MHIMELIFLLKRARFLLITDIAGAIRVETVKTNFFLRIEVRQAIANEPCA